MNRNDWIIVAMLCSVLLIVIAGRFAAPYTITDAFLDGHGDDFVLTARDAKSAMQEMLKAAGRREAMLEVPLLIGSIILLLANRSIRQNVN